MVDYPFSANTRGRDSLGSLELSEAEMDALRGGNAGRAFWVVDCVFHG